MGLNSNNNRKIIFYIAKSNLMGKKLYSFFSFFTILLSIAFVSAMMLFLQGAQTVEKRMLDNMQQVMFLNVPKEQMEEIKRDQRVEIMVPYKEGGETFQVEGVNYGFCYMTSQASQIKTYELAEGREPETYNEIVVEKYFMEKIGQSCQIGQEIILPVQGEREKFVISGYTDQRQERSAYSVYVSKAFAEESPWMEEVPYAALVRVVHAPHMEASHFETVVYEMAMDYGVKRPDVNINGRFEESLQDENAAFYGIALVSLFILAASAIVIYCIFYLSVASRTQQIGQFQTIGMTQKQVKKMVRLEGLMLSGISIPAGLLLGGAIAYFLEPDGFSFPNYALAAVLIGLFGLLAVQVSVGKPAALAAKVSPVEAAKNLTEEGLRKSLGAGLEDSPSRPGKRKRLTAFVMAQMGQRGSRKKRRLMTASLAYGGVIFMVAASYLCSWDELSYSRAGEFEQAEYIVSYNYNAHNPSAYGPTQMQLTGHLSQALKEKLSRIAHVQSVEAENSAFGSVEYQGATWVEGFYPLAEDSEEFFAMDMDGNGSYEYLRQHDAVLVTKRGFLSGLYGVSFQAGDRMTLHWFDGEEHSIELEIAAVTEDMVPGNYSFFMADQTMRKLWGGMSTVSSFAISVQDYEIYGQQAEQEILAAIEPYGDLSLRTLRERQIDDSANIKKIKMQIYGISAFVILFSILNLVNMLLGSIAIRKRELSMLESIGMEERQIRAMLFWEGVQLVFPAIFITVAVGGAAGYGFVLFMQRIASYLEYQFPAIPIMLYVAAILFMPLAVSYISLKAHGRAPLVERIK